METLSQLFVEAGTLMLAGMVFVFAFLGILIVLINKVLAPLANKYPDPVPVTQTKMNKPIVNSGVSDNVVAAISAAVTQYRNKHQK